MDTNKFGSSINFLKSIKNGVLPLFSRACKFKRYLQVLNRTFEYITVVRITHHHNFFDFLQLTECL
uniref:Si618008b02f n=1 Tax=Arundo donax TaxID=35708 RepID=A0A0A9CDR8_ARUDO